MKKTTYILLEMLAVTASNVLRCKPGAYYETYIVVDEGRFYIQDSGLSRIGRGLTHRAMEIRGVYNGNIWAKGQ